jgi:hypothetical protein
MPKFSGGLRTARLNAHTGSFVIRSDNPSAQCCNSTSMPGRTVSAA